MRIGIFLGFLLGAIVASVMGERRATDDRVAEVTVVVSPPQPEIEAEGPIGKLKQRLREAKAAADQAADEKEAELQRQFEAATKRKS